MIALITVLTFFTLLSILIGCWGAQKNYKDTAVSGVIGAFCFGIPMIFALFKGASL